MRVTTITCDNCKKELLLAQVTEVEVTIHCDGWGRDRSVRALHYTGDLCASCQDSWVGDCRAKFREKLERRGFDTND